MRRGFAVSLLWVLTLGCASSGAWKYEPVSQQLAPHPLAASRVAVLPFEDRRPQGNSDKKLLYLIPLVPWGSFEYNQIEAGSGFLTHAAYQIRPAEDLAKAVVAELAKANLFQEIFYTEREQEPGVDYFLKGGVDEFRYDGRLYSYGFSAYAPYFWLFGLPAGRTKNSLDVSLELRRAGDGEVLWRSHPDRMERSLTSGLYYNWGKEFESYPQMMQEAARQWVEELSSYVRQNPVAFAPAPTPGPPSP